MKSRAVDWELRASILVVLLCLGDTELHRPSDEEALMRVALFVLCAMCCVLQPVEVEARFRFSSRKSFEMGMGNCMHNDHLGCVDRR